MRNKRRLARVDLRRGAGDGVALGDENLIAALGHKYRLRVDGHCLSTFHPHPVDFRAAAGNGEHTLVIIEGLFALYLPEILEHLDLKVFVDLKSDARLVRRIRRHLEWGDTFDEITDRYIDTVRFRHDEFVEPSRWRADMVVNGTLEGQEIAILSTYIESKIDL